MTAENKDRTIDTSSGLINPPAELSGDPMAILAHYEAEIALPWVRSERNSNHQDNEDDGPTEEDKDDGLSNEQRQLANAWANWNDVARKNPSMG